MCSKACSEALSGAQAIVPLAFGVVIYGLAFGFLASQAGLTGVEVGSMGALVFGGSSQIVAVERLAAGAGITAALVAGFALNLRLLLLTASVRDLFAGRPIWQQVFGAHLTADENWALTLAKRSQGESVGYWFLIGAGLVLMFGWVASSVMGVAFASRIPDPETYAIDFAFTAAFIAIARSLWNQDSDIAAWLVSVAIVIALISSKLIEPSWAIVLGGIGGAVTAAFRRNV